MHLLIILLQQLLGMLPGSKTVPQAEVVRNGGANPNSGEPDACGGIAMPHCGWMTPFEAFYGALARPTIPSAAPRRLSRLCIAALRARWPMAEGGAVPRRTAQAETV